VKGWRYYCPECPPLLPCGLGYWLVARSRPGKLEHVFNVHHVLEFVHVSGYCIASAKAESERNYAELLEVVLGIACDRAWK